MSVQDDETKHHLCLAYKVLRDPDPWIGGPSTIHLDTFLQGVRLRHSCVASTLPEWRITGVLEDPAFYQMFVDTTGHPKLTIRWATALAMTHHSFVEGFAKLRNCVLEWHEKRGFDEQSSETSDQIKWSDAEVVAFWNRIAERPAMFVGGGSGWMLYCFLNGMQKGGDWLGLSKMPYLDDFFESVKHRSQETYGSQFAAFHVYNAQEIFEKFSQPLNHTDVLSSAQTKTCGSRTVNRRDN